jgi:hypothetical protein
MEPARDEHSHSPVDSDPEPEPETGEASYPSAFDSVVNALIDAGPEVADHLVNAARELLLAAHALVDAAAGAVQEQQQVREARAGGVADISANVHHLDRTE